MIVTTTMLTMMTMMITMTKMAIEATANQVQKLSTWQQTAPPGQLAAYDYHPHDGDDDDHDDGNDANDNDEDVESSTVLSSDQLSSVGTACVQLHHWCKFILYFSVKSAPYTRGTNH